MPHTDDSCCFVVQLWIVHDGKVLLRLHDKWDLWLGVGGHVDPGEDPLQAAHREAKEEVGLDVHIPGEPDYAPGDEFTLFPQPLAIDRHKVSETHDHFCIEFAASADSDRVVQPDNHERTVCKWCTREEIESMDIPESTRRLCVAALDLLG